MTEWAVWYWIGGIIMLSGIVVTALYPYYWGIGLYIFVFGVGIFTIGLVRSFEAIEYGSLQ